MVDEKSVMAVIRAARPSFRNPHDKMAFAMHACFLASGHVLHAAGPAAFSDNALSSPATDEVGIDDWNQFDEEYAFLYSNPEKVGSKVLVKCLVMNDKLLVDALRDGSSEPAHLEINMEEYDRENGGTNYGLQFQNFEKLVSKVNKEILSKLYGSSTESLPAQPSSSRTRDVEVTEPEGPNLNPTGLVYPPVNPMGGGASDLYPGPGAGMYPTRGDFGIGGGPGGMFVGPNHPIFGIGGRGRDTGFPGGLPGVPPGARFDPYGPPGIPGFEPNRFTRNPPRPGGGTHPDLEPYGDGSDFI